MRILSAAYSMFCFISHFPLLFLFHFVHMIILQQQSTKIATNKINANDATTYATTVQAPLPLFVELFGWATVDEEVAIENTQLSSFFFT